jgi:O-glycosyl hydrolase
MKRSLIWLKRSCGLLSIVLFAGCGMNELRETISTAGSQEAVITIDPSKRYQTITGWEATAQAGQDFRSFHTYGGNLLSDAVNQLGLNRLRLALKSGTENSVDHFQSFISKGVPLSGPLRYEIINDNDDPYLINDAGFQFSQLDDSVEKLVIPMRQLLNERGEKLLVNLNYVDFGKSDFEHKDHPEEYAELILATFLHMRDKYGFVPDLVEIVLEPDTDAASWSAQQVAQAIVATAARLKANGFEPEFVAPSTTNAADALKYIDEIATVPGALESVAEFSYHRYAGVSDEVLAGIAERAARYGKRVSMLEWIGADRNTLHKDLTLANASAWQQYTLAYSGPDKGDAYYKIDSEESTANFAMGERTRYLRQYFRYIRPGAVHIAASTSNQSLYPVAFVNPDGGNVVVINAAASGTASIQNLRAGRYAVTHAVADKADAGVDYVSSNGTEPIKVSIPGPGVVTVASAGLQ